MSRRRARGSLSGVEHILLSNKPNCLCLTPSKSYKATLTRTKIGSFIGAITSSCPVGQEESLLSLLIGKQIFLQSVAIHFSNNFC